MVAVSYERGTPVHILYKGTLFTRHGSGKNEAILREKNLNSIHMQPTVFVSVFDFMDVPPTDFSVHISYERGTPVMS